jgi:deoxyadenosine/deoxycytidine kinase
VIIWINGGLGAGKTTLAGELHWRLPDAVVYDPEDVGDILRRWTECADSGRLVPVRCVCSPPV